MALETSLKFALAFVLVLGLIALGTWTLRRFGLGISGVAARGRRLAVVESLALDARHRLVLVRRDDREHLVLLGATETVVEAGIVAPSVASQESQS
ncbi:MAG: flagellar biosynthetic protein FliO [Gemmatimonas sp.]